MAFSTSARSSVASLIWTATTWANVAVNATSSPITDIQISAHTADPTSGNQTSSEASYTSYARVAVARTTSGWTDTAGVVTNDAAITFPAATGGSSTLTHIGCGRDASSTGQLFVAGACSPNLSVTNGVQPIIGISGLTITVA